MTKRSEQGIEQLIERSSFGTPDAKRFRALTPASVVEAIVARLESAPPRGIPPISTHRSSSKAKPTDPK
jgi:hypothetical protein